jgi:hypothetical protein
LALPAVTTGLSRVDSWQEQHELVGLEDAVVASRLKAALHRRCVRRPILTSADACREVAEAVIQQDATKDSDVSQSYRSALTPYWAEEPRHLHKATAIVAELPDEEAWVELAFVPDDE